MSTMKKVISLMLCVAMLLGTFAIAGSVASAEELSGAPLENTNIDSYESLVAQYGTNKDKDGNVDGFIYVGAEVVESNGKITDGFVKPGDVLTVRLYVKSNMYTGSGIMFMAFDNKFFDVKLPAGADASVDANGYTSNYDGGYINATHPMVAPNGMTHKITSITLKNAGGWVKNCGFTDTYLAETDIINSQTPYDVTIASGEPYKMTSDEYLLSYEVKVKEGLADGTKGVIDSPVNLWQAYINPKTGKHHGGMQGYIPAKPIAEGVTFDNIAVKMSTQLDNGVLDNFILDATHTLEIGEGEATQYTANFYAENQTDIVATDKYDVGAAVAFPASVENQIGWAIVREGVTAPGTVLYPAEDGTYSYTMKEADVDFLRILSTNKFPVKFAIGQETLPGPVNPETGRPTVIYSVTVNEDKLPEGMKFIKEEWAIQIDLPIGQPFDLASIPDDAVVKVGNEITGWDTTTVAPPSTIEGTVITLNAVNGAMGSDITVSSKAIWNPELYTVNFYLNEEAYKNKTPLKTLEGLTYGQAAVYNGVDAETGKTYSIENEIKDKKFAGWVDADTGEVLSAVDNIKAIYDKDLELYAKWVDYANSVTFMVRDYETGKWVANKPIVFRGELPEGEQATFAANDVKNAIAAACKDESITFQHLYSVNPDEIKDGNYKDYQVAGAFQVAPGVYSATDIKYNGNVVYYIATSLDCKVTWKAPAYDEKTNTFDDTKATVISEETVKTAFYAGAGDPYAATSKLTTAIEAPTGYTHTGWKDAETGEAVELNAEGAYVISGKVKEATLIATYELVKYPVAFNLRNGATPDIVMLDGTVTLGGSIEIKGAKFTLNGKASALPEIGLDNSKQPDGGYALPEGYKFAGWTLGFGSGATEATFPVKLTADMIRKNFANGAINFNGTWEAQEYTLTFYITNAEGNEEEFATYKVKAGEEIASYKNVTAEIAKAVNDKAPEGKTFSNIWYNKETSAADTMTKMPAKNVAYYAVYGTSSVNVYVDYNFLAEKDLNQTMQLFKAVTLLYGSDVAQVKEEDPYFNRSFETVVKRSPITLKPADASEVIGWNIYHVAPGEDPYTAEWKSGYNDEGTTIATTTIIFQPIWKAHKDMLIRVYDTDGNIAHALGKDLKTYFWNSGEIVESSGDTTINRNTDLYLTCILTMSIENWDWNEFFNIEMWQSLTLRFDPFPIPRSWLTWEGFKGILDAIGNALGSLF